MKNTSNVAVEFFNFGIFRQFLSHKKLTSLVTLFDRKIQVFKNSPKLAIFAIFNERLSTQNVNVARNVECDFLTYFETLCEKTRFLIYWKIGQVIIPMARRGSEVLKSMKPIYQDVASLMMAER